MRILALRILDLEGIQVQKVYMYTTLLVPSCAGGVCAAAHSSVCSTNHPIFHVRALTPG